MVKERHPKGKQSTLEFAGTGKREEFCPRGDMGKGGEGGRGCSRNMCGEIYTRTWNDLTFSDATVRRS